MEGMEISKGKVDASFWKGKKVYLTGHTGFKGSWLSLWLQNMGALVKGYSLDVNTQPALFKQANVAAEMESEIGDIRNLEQLTKSMVSFRPLNLLNSYSLMGRFDIVFCRNVLIYFSPGVKAKIISQIHGVLNPGGYLMLGASESLSGLNKDFTMVRCNPGIVYQKQ
jgi:SAM-dependent methyltransferase